MSNTEMTIKENIAILKESKFECPAFLLDEERMIANYPPLTDAEKMEWAEFSVRQSRALVSRKYILSCGERFGKLESGNVIFTHENCTAEIDFETIETLLIHQIEKTILEFNPVEKHIALWRFYLGNEVDEKENNSTWMRDFIDGVFIDGFKLFTADPASLTEH
ncbi:hypothetical protein KKJ09_13945 [Xenorhabdus bovienii]|uniref:hypothetical protein n=1 Tax=Xenorhabdus bovienii TaxID=40576 RepID=UPI0023B2DD67|nr:hypothetical protein [Xenorhabdus bovienii]MDE9494658.1 hypothetical protein [Xenorhabdus bovienii]MDE9503292.1 hypothetical protein [Xenorhabdus bovienii]MDE9528086.1 hypothetical protein [Xenorhabdus bovienii]